MIINYFLNTIFLKVVKTKLVNNYRAYIRKKNNMIKYNNNWYIIKLSVSEEIHSIYEHLNYPEVHYSEQ